MSLRFDNSDGIRSMQRFFDGLPLLLAVNGRDSADPNLIPERGGYSPRPAAETHLSRTWFQRRPARDVSLRFSAVVTRHASHSEAEPNQSRSLIPRGIWNPGIWNPGIWNLESTFQDSNEIHKPWSEVFFVSPWRRFVDVCAFHPRSSTNRTRTVGGLDFSKDLNLGSRSAIPCKLFDSKLH